MPLLNRKSTAEQVSSGIDLSGKNALVTGANAGIGVETVRVLALRGAHVTMACRNPDKAAQARRAIIGGSLGAVRHDQIDLLELDLNSLAETRHAAVYEIRSAGRRYDRLRGHQSRV